MHSWIWKKAFTLYLSFYPTNKKKKLWEQIPFSFILFVMLEIPWQSFIFIYLDPILLLQIYYFGKYLVVADAYLEKVKKIDRK